MARLPHIRECKRITAQIAHKRQLQYLAKQMRREDDEVLAQALAAAAGIAIDNARLYEQSQRRQSWIEATRDIGTALLSGTEPAEVFRLIAEAARWALDQIALLRSAKTQAA